MMMPRLQKWGSFFLPRKQKSLSLFLSSTRKHPTARVREELLYSALRERRSLSLTSLFFFERARLREFTSCIILSFVRIRCFSLFPFAWKNEAFFCLCFFVLFFHSFVFVESSRFWKLFFSTSFDWMNAFFKTRGRKSRSTPNTLFSLWLFSWENTLFFRFVLTHPHKITFPYSLYSSSFSEDALA